MEREPRDFPLRTPRSSGQEDELVSSRRTPLWAWVTGLAGIWLLLGFLALLLLALGLVFA